jgi:hypothetical protein
MEFQPIFYRKATMAQTADNSPSSPSTNNSEIKVPRYTVIQYPKVIFFYPLMFVSIICGFLQLAKGDSPSNLAGTIFVAMFLFNILVISFDFPGVKALALALGTLAVTFGLILFDQHVFRIFGPLGKAMEAVYTQLHASVTLYFCVSGILFVMISGGVLGNILWDRWTIEPNRLKHKDGLFSFKEYPVIDLQVDKEVEDIFEYALLFSGTLTFTIPSHKFRLENIPLIYRAERKIQEIVRQREKH